MKRRALDERVLAQLGKRIGQRQNAAGIVEIEPALALRRIIERVAERGEIGQASRQRVERRSPARRARVRLSLRRCVRARRPFLGWSFRRAAPSSRSRFPVAASVAQKRRHDTLRARKERPPLDHHRLEELALRYVERFATTRAKLRDYLRRKLRERGWKGMPSPISRRSPTVRRASAMSTTRLTRSASRDRCRGAATANGGWSQKAARRRSRRRRRRGRPALADEEAVSSALRFAERRRLGPFACGRRRSARPRESARRDGPGRPRLRAGAGDPRACRPARESIPTSFANALADR